MKKSQALHRIRLTRKRFDTDSPENDQIFHSVADASPENPDEKTKRKSFKTRLSLDLRPKLKLNIKPKHQTMNVPSTLFHSVVSTELDTRDVEDCYIKH